MSCRAIALTAAMVCVLAQAHSAWGIEVEDLPQWVRDRLSPVHLDLVPTDRPADEQAASTASPEIVGVRATHVVSPGALDSLTPVRHGPPAKAPANVAEELAGIRTVGMRPSGASGRGESNQTGPTAAPPRVDMRTYVLLSKLRELIARDDSDTAKLEQWIDEHHIGRPLLIEALDSIPLSHPMDPVYLPICGVLRGETGGGVDPYLKFPYSARVFMATYLGVLGQEQDAKALLNSLPKRDPAPLGADMYHVANELAFHRAQSPRLAIWAWKKGAEMRGAADQAFVCSHVRQTCERLGDPAMVREEFIPWAEEALARPGSEPRWPWALRNLLWAYDHVGESALAIQRGTYWLEQSTQRGVPPEDLWESTRRLAHICLKEGRAKEATQVLPPRFRQVSPDELLLKGERGVPIRATLVVKGNATLDVATATCPLTFVEVSLGKKSFGEREASREVLVTVQPSAPLGRHRSSLLIDTSGPGRKAAEVPLLLQVLPSVKLKPAEVAFGVLRRGQSRTVTVTASTDGEPFAVSEATCSAPQFEVLSLRKASPCSWEIVAAILGTTPPGCHEAQLIIRTSLDPDRLRVPVRAVVR